MTAEQKCAALNLLPRWRSIHLNHMRHLRMMIRDGRQVYSARECLKRAQAAAGRQRAAYMAYGA